MSFGSPPSPQGPYRQPGPDPAAADEHALHMLSVLYYIYGAFVALAALGAGAFALLPALLFAGGASNGPGALPPPLAGGMFAVIFGAVAAVLMGKAVVMLLAGHALGRRRRYMLCLVGACTALMNMPLGTALGVYALVVLMRPEVKARFGQSLPPPGANALSCPARQRGRAAFRHHSKTPRIVEIKLSPSGNAFWHLT